MEKALYTLNKKGDSGFSADSGNNKKSRGGGVLLKEKTANNAKQSLKNCVR